MRKPITRHKVTDATFLYFVYTGNKFIFTTSIAVERRQYFVGKKYFLNTLSLCLLDIKTQVLPTFPSKFFHIRIKNLRKMLLLDAIFKSEIIVLNKLSFIYSNLTLML